MTDKQAKKNRRKFLTLGVTVLGGIGVGGMGVPFAKSLLLSERVKALGADVVVDISDIAPGEMKVVEWRRSPVWILRRTEAMLKNLSDLEQRLKDPHSTRESQQPRYAKNQYRSINPEYLVVMGVCTHLGCAPHLRPEFGGKEMGDWWRGGFFCPCHKSGYDFSGRVFEGSPAPMNLPVPPYRFISATDIVIGNQTS